jgi:hypothetical protein
MRDSQLVFNYSIGFSNSIIDSINDVTYAQA